MCLLVVGASEGGFHLYSEKVYVSETAVICVNVYKGWLAEPTVYNSQESMPRFQATFLPLTKKGGRELGKRVDNLYNTGQR